MEKKNVFLAILLCSIFIILGVVFIVMGINAKNRNEELKIICTEEIQGIVDSFHESGYYGEDEDGDIVDERLYYPIFQYEVNNETYTKQSPTGKGEKRFRLGEEITIMYNPENPDDYYVPADTYAAKAGGTTMGFGIFMIAVIPFLLVISFIRNRKDYKRNVNKNKEASFNIDNN